MADDELPSLLAVRSLFELGGQAAARALEKHVPEGIESLRDLVYCPNDPDARLDVHLPGHSPGSDPLPVVVWVHGGGWVSGSKDLIANYLKIVASHGFATVGIDYTRAPEGRYPTPVVQVLAGLKFLGDQAARLHIDPNRMVLAGDSAGAQIAAQVATVVTNPSYAGQTGLAPTITQDRLRGALLFCGAFDIGLTSDEGPFGGLLQSVLSAYSGSEDFRTDPAFATASVRNYVTSTFPPAFISAGNVDPLLSQSEAFADALAAVGVRVERYFFATDHEPSLDHEYQFDLDGAEGREALDRAVMFLKGVTGPPGGVDRDA
ncbi:MAG: alpha/beta hydrolase [Acidimicrobiales bacterium]